MTNDGSYSNEFEAAYDLSRREMPRDDKGKIARLTAAGRFVVYVSSEAHCPFTDASLGERRHYVEDYSTYEAAAESIPEEAEDYAIATPAPWRGYPAASTVADDDGIAF